MRCQTAVPSIRSVRASTINPGPSVISRNNNDGGYFVTLKNESRVNASLGFGTGFAHAEVPAAILEVAAEREFPVFEVPYELPFIAVTEAAFTQLVNEQYAILRRALAAQERLERILLSERGLEALAGALATLIGAAVLVFDPRGELLAERAFRRAVDPERLGELSAELRERAGRRARSC